MSTVVKEVMIPNKRRIDIELPPEVPVGEAVVTVTIVPKAPVNRLGELFGQGKGEIWIADDFDAPLNAEVTYPLFIRGN